MSFRILDLKSARPEDGQIRLSATIDVSGVEKEMWFETSLENADMVDLEGYEPFVVALLAEAAKTGANIEVEGRVSKRLLRGLATVVCPSLQVFFGAPKATHIIASERESGQGSGTLTGFSAGVDSFCTMVENDSITHLSLHNFGERMRPHFERKVERLSPVAAEFGLPFLAVKSNIEDFVTGPHDLTHSLKNAAMALFFQKEIGTYLYSSGYTYSETFVAPSTDIAHLDPVILPAIRTEGFQCEPFGAHLSRVQKTAMAARNPVARKWLDVCTRPHLAPKGKFNCGICWKCMRTEFALEALGELQNFKDAFPIDSYRKFRNIYLIEVFGSKDPLVAENRDLAVRAGMKFPVRVQFAGRILPDVVVRNISRTFRILVRYERLRSFLNTVLTSPRKARIQRLAQPEG